MSASVHRDQSIVYEGTQTFAGLEGSEMLPICVARSPSVGDWSVAGASVVRWGIHGTCRASIWRHG